MEAGTGAEIRESPTDVGQILDGVLEVFKNQHDESIKDSAEMVERQARGLEAIAKLLTASREEN